MKRIGQLVFLGAVLLALALYALTAPDGLPWNDSTHLALAYLGETVRLPVMSHPVWGCYVQVFGGAVALSVVMTAVAAGLLAFLVCRYFGWRFAVSAAIVWIFLPGVWNRAITGERGICLAALAVVAVWVANGVVVRVWRKLNAVAREASGGLGASALPSAHEAVARRGKVNRIAGWVAMGAAGLFGVLSLTFHDYRYGEAASAFARGVVEDAGERMIVLNGAVDDQVVAAVNGRRSKVGQRYNENGNVHCLTSDLGPLTFSVIALRNDDAYRTGLVAWVRSAFPTETNLSVAAQVGAAAFVEAAVRTHPDRFYLMGGRSTTPEAWERRWEAFVPYLESSDPFVRVARRMFGYEGNVIANAICAGEESADDGCRRRTAAWQLYKRIYAEIDPGNFSSLVNMGELIRRGHAVSGDEKKKVQGELEKFFRDVSRREHVREIVRAAGPVSVDPAFIEKMAAESKARIAAKIAAGEKVECSPEVLSLVEWNNEMVRHMNKGEIVKAARIARAILSNPKWRDFIPANAVMGSMAASEGDYVTSEAFFRAVAVTTNAVPAVVFNDYADTLIRLGKLDEAEKMARRAVEGSRESFWISRLTLAQVLEKKVGNRCQEGAGKVDGGDLSEFAAPAGAETEIRALLKSVLKHAPAKVCAKIRRDHRGYVR